MTKHKLQLSNSISDIVTIEEIESKYFVEYFFNGSKETIIVENLDDILVWYGSEAKNISVQGDYAHVIDGVVCKVTHWHLKHHKLSASVYHPEDRCWLLIDSTELVQKAQAETEAIRKIFTTLNLD